MNPAPTLATLAADPDRIADVAPDQVPELIGACAALQAALHLRLQAGAVQATPAPATTGADTLLTAQQAAERLGVSRRWMYRHADSLPFTRKLSGGTLRFSSKGLERWQERRAA